MKKYIPFLIIVIFAGLIFFFLQNKKEIPNADIRHGVNVQNEVSSVQIGGQTLNVEVADTLELRTQGLSGRATIAEDEGMLFVFDEPGEYLFWMKDMNFPIDIIWFNELKQIVHIEKNVEPESYPQTFGPKEKTSSFVLEVFSGFSDKYDLKIGDTIQFVNFNYSNVPR